MQAPEENSREPRIFKKILSNSFLAAFFGGILAFVVLSASPEKFLEFGANNTSSASGGIGLIGFFGSVVWNFLISVVGALFFGFITAIGLLIFYSMPRKQKNTD